VHQCAQMILEPSAARERLTSGIFHIDDDRGLARLEKAFALVTAADSIDRRMRAARLKDWREAVKRGVITASEGERIRAAEEAVAKVIEVDDFASEQLSKVNLKSISREELFAREVRAAS
jgi:acyl-CoA dehydrogenase